MKKSKIIVITLLSLLLLTGCFKRDKMDNIKIVTTVFPIENLVNNIYGYNSTITSIYPAEIDFDTYEITHKKLKDYSACDVFIYNGLTNEKNIAAALINKNNKIKLVDVTKGISIKRDEEELWLSPANYLMLAENIKNNLSEYTTSTILLKEINNNYENLKLEISKYDAEFKLIASSTDKPYIIVGNDVFKFLEKYGFTVYSVEDNDLFEASDYTNAKTLIEAKMVNYIFLLDTDKIDENTQKMIDLGVSVVRINSIKNLTEDEVAENYQYDDMMTDFIEKIKEEVYN